MSTNRPLPDWLIIGAPKAGTTTLAAWLGEHPGAYVSPVK
ncbi:MAG: Sulfotransferase domain, partial [Acidimicrobiaceae bacterium]